MYLLAVPEERPPCHKDGKSAVPWPAMLREASRDMQTVLLHLCCRPALLAGRTAER